MSPQDAQTYCKNVSKNSGSNFYYSFLFLPPDRRDLMYTIYALCREVDNAVDDPPPGIDPLDQVRCWRKEVAAAYEGTPTFPVTISLAHHLQTVDIPQIHFQELISGVEMDLTITRYQTFEDLYPYCYRVASVVGLICLNVFGTRAPEATEYATNLGLAFQLTNILRDVGSDTENNRIYLPQEDFTRFGYSEQDLFARQHTPEFIEFMKFQCRRAREYYSHAQRILQALPPADRRALIVAEIMRGVYSRILDKIEANNYQVFGPRVSLPSSNRLLIAAGIWLRSSLFGTTTQQA
ncbi:MAG: phytoene synthase [Nitrospirales bacterium]|nr:MAG: phytoene synthase [Nitrospirales bacterium]